MPEPAGRRIKLSCDYRGDCSDNSRLLAIVLYNAIYWSELDFNEWRYLSYSMVLHVNDFETLRPILTNGLIWLCVNEEFLKCNLT